MLRRVSDTRTQLLVTDSRYFSTIELHTAQTEHRQNSHAEYDDTHTADPLHQCAP